MIIISTSGGEIAKENGKMNIVAKGAAIAVVLFMLSLPVIGTVSATSSGTRFSGCSSVPNYVGTTYDGSSNGANSIQGNCDIYWAGPIGDRYMIYAAKDRIQGNEVVYNAVGTTTNSAYWDGYIYFYDPASGNLGYHNSAVTIITKTPSPAIDTESGSGMYFGINHYSSYAQTSGYKTESQFTRNVDWMINFPCAAEGIFNYNNWEFQVSCFKHIWAGHSDPTFYDYTAAIVVPIKQSGWQGTNVQYNGHFNINNGNNQISLFATTGFNSCGATVDA